MIADDVSEQLLSFCNCIRYWNLPFCKLCITKLLCPIAVYTVRARAPDKLLKMSPGVLFPPPKPQPSTATSYSITGDSGVDKQVTTGEELSAGERRGEKREEGGQQSRTPASSHLNTRLLSTSLRHFLSATHSFCR